jgi:hypothetical protein
MAEREEGTGRGWGRRTDSIFLRRRKGEMAFGEAGSICFVGIDEILLDGSGSHGGREAIS